MSPRLSDLLLRSQSDERLVSLAASGHDRAFGTIVERYRPELLAMARRLVSDGRAEDVLQQALLSAFAALRSDTEVRHVRGWLYQIVRNAAFNTRSPSESPLDESTASGPTLEEVVQQRALAMSAMTEISHLPERQRAALVGSVGGVGRAELAASMGLSEGAVRQLVHRARATVRSAVTAVTPWPLANWLAATSGGTGGTSEVIAAAGALSGGGMALKFGALLATGAVATGVAVVPRQHHPRAQTTRAAAGPARASASPHVLGSTALPAGVLRSVASVGVGERHHGGESGDSRGGGSGGSRGGGVGGSRGGGVGGSRGGGSGGSRGGGSGGSRGGERNQSSGKRRDDSRSRVSSGGGSSSSDEGSSAGGARSGERAAPTTASGQESRGSGDESGSGSGSGSGGLRDASSGGADGWSGGADGSSGGADGSSGGADGSSGGADGSRD